MTSERAPGGRPAPAAPAVRLNRPLPPGDRGRPGRAGEPPVLRHLRAAIARGYRPASRPRSPVRHLLPGRPPLPEARAAADALRGGRRPPPVLALVAPTYVARASLAEQLTHLDGLLAQLARAERDHPEAPFVLLVGMQWTAPAEEAEAERRLTALLDRAAATHPELRCCGLALPGPGKPRTLNAAIAVAEHLGCAGVGWVDDDVALEPGCLARLARDFLAAGRRGAVGATKVPHTRAHVASRVLARAKAVAAPATSYPHGCCILVATDVVAGGLPDRYSSDDGYVCFRLLDPQLPDPLRHLRLVPDAHCHYFVAGPAGETRRRLRRLVLHHVVDLADWPLPVARYYFRHVLFGGMWPLTGWDGSRGLRHGARKAAWKWAYFGWFCAVGGELYLRGLLRRPLREIHWAPYSAPGRPARTREELR